MTKQEVESIIAQGKFAIAEALEGRTVTSLNGSQCQVKGGKIQTGFGWFSLLMCNIDTLENFLRQQATEQELQASKSL